MKEFWNTRYQEAEFAYGTEPNDFFKSKILQLDPGKILFPAEGEGRNAVFAAKLGWEVFAFDQSEAAKDKAEALSEKMQVNLNYQVISMQDFDPIPESFDAVVLVFAHFPAFLRRAYHQKLLRTLKPGGLLILEGFSKNHIKHNTTNEKAGGPKDIQMLFSLEELKGDFEETELVILEEKERYLQEGLYHQGQAAVIQLLAVKK